MTKTTVSRAAVLEQILEVLPISDKLVAYKLGRKVSFGGEGEIPKTLVHGFPSSVVQGLASPEAIAAYELGFSDRIVATTHLNLVTPAFLESARREGFLAAMQEHLPFDGECGIFDALQADPGQVELLVQIEFSSHMLFDRHGEVLPTGIYYSYVNGSARDGVYDLKQLIVLLSSHPQISPRLEDGAQEWRPSRVPYYNVSKGCSECVSFMFSPTTEQMRVLWAKMQSLSPKYPSTRMHEAIFALDMLGLRKAGVAKSQSYWGDASTQEEDSEEDSDSDSDWNEHSLDEENTDT